MLTGKILSLQEVNSVGLLVSSSLYQVELSQSISWAAVPFPVLVS